MKIGKLTEEKEYTWWTDDVMCFDAQMIHNFLGRELEEDYEVLSSDMGKVVIRTNHGAFLIEGHIGNGFCNKIIIKPFENGTNGNN